MSPRAALSGALASLALAAQAEPAQAAVEGARTCKPIEAVAMKFYGVQTNLFTCRAARSILSAYARKPPAIREATVSIGRQRFVCWVYNDPSGGGCGAKKRRGAIGFRSVKWVAPTYATECGEVGTKEGTDEGLFRIRTVGLDCDTVRSMLEMWTAEGYPGDGPTGWSQCRSLPQPAGAQVACSNPRVWFESGA